MVPNLLACLRKDFHTLPVRITAATLNIFSKKNVLPAFDIKEPCVQITRSHVQLPESLNL